jgi:hypothetical protein
MEQLAPETRARLQRLCHAHIHERRYLELRRAPPGLRGAGDDQPLLHPEGYANGTLHDVRDEDEPNMPIRWTRFDLAPRSFAFQNPTEQPPAQ